MAGTGSAIPAPCERIAALGPSAEIVRRFRGRETIDAARVHAGGDGSIENADLDARKALGWATRGGAAALELGDRIGSIEPGKKPDLVLLDAAATSSCASRTASGASPSFAASRPRTSGRSPTACSACATNGATRSSATASRPNASTSWRPARWPCCHPRTRLPGGSWSRAATCSAGVPSSPAPRAR